MAGLLAIYAHPDDETFGIGGTMAHYADRGIPVTMICATRGEVGEIAPGTGATPETLGQYREQELRDAMKILGVSDVRFLDFRDSGMQGTPENEDPRSLNKARPEAVVGPLVGAIRELQPEIIATWDASGGYGHPDHIAIHHHASAAYHAAADAKQYARADAPWRTRALYYTAIPVGEFERLGQEMRKRGIDMGEAPGGNDNLASLPRVEPNCIIDVTAQYERKQQAFAAHRTQFSPDDPFANMPEDIARSFFGREFFYRADPPLPAGTQLGDLLAQLP
ncbi:MAG: PIG-L family deacetylase [Chloroflexota bacterium]|nr:PIG-L family deacetylase [Chloroflexota bacterium]